jgi:site-specific recombinase XerD
MFLRFLAATKKAPESLVSSVPQVAGWKLSSLPRFLPAADIDKIIAACDDRTDTALRDRAIILLASRLALRAGEIAALTFGDVDWEQACVRVSGKSRCEVWLPIPQDVGEAILAYLEGERPSIPEEHVFVKAVAPHGAITSPLVSSVVRRAMDRAGIKNAPTRGAHVLRHSAATAMLREGATLHQIGSVLRHKSIETTYHYAKVDLDLLRMVVSPWPELTGVTQC